MKQAADDEDDRLRAVAMQNAQSILLARQRAEEAMLGAKQALEVRSAQLARSLAMMRATLESTTDAILVTDDAGNVADWNERLVDMWGLSHEMLTARSPDVVLRTIGRQCKDSARFVPGVEHICRSAVPESFDLLELSDGRSIERFSRLQVVDGRNVGRVWSFRDVTARRLAEEAARQAAEERRRLLDNERAARAEAERTNAMKDAFLANLSHELRTPLSSIVGWSQVLRRSAPENGELRRGLEAIERNARAQTQLIEDLLDMNRITSGKVRLDIQPVDAVAVIEAAIETVRPAAEAKAIAIARLLDPSTGLVNGDPNRMQQIVWNLLSNAIKFTPKGGRVRVVLERHDSLARIGVADTGIGISAEFLGHVFERFRQEDASSTRRYSGLGLGLAIVKHLVELHGGTVAARSPGENCGATFTVHLPLASPRAVGAEHPLQLPRLAPLELQASDLAGIKVLVVDDHLDARELVRRVLADCGAQVFIAATPEEALSAVESERPDVLVSDIGMPDMDGLELLRKVRALGSDYGGGVPAIALTAFARAEDRMRALRGGFLAHVSKPVELSELVATVASVAGRTGVLGAD